MSGKGYSLTYTENGSLDTVMFPLLRLCLTKAEITYGQIRKESESLTRIYAEPKLVIEKIFNL